MRLLDLFAGIGGFSYAAHWMGWKTAAFVEREPFCQQVLKKNFPGVPIYDDVRGYNGKLHAVEIICGGFPCQPASIAGKRKGKADDRYLFPEMLRIVDEARPRWVVAENVRGLLSIDGGELFEEICSSLECIDYSVQAFCIPASAVNAPHRRDRVWIIAHANGGGAMGEGRNGSGHNVERNTATEVQEWQNVISRLELADSPLFADTINERCIGRQEQRQDRERPVRQGRGNNRSLGELAIRSWDEPWPQAVTRLCALDDGIPGGLVRPKRWRVNALKAAGNAISPPVAYKIFRAIEAADL